MGSRPRASFGAIPHWLFRLESRQDYLRRKTLAIGRARRTATARPRDSRRYRPRRAAADPHRVRNDLSRGPAQNRRAGGVTAKLHHNCAIVSVYSCEIRRRDTPRNRQLKELRIPDLDLIKQAEQGCGKGLHLPTRSANFIAHPAVFVDDRNAGIFIWRKRRAARPKHPGPSALGRSSGASCCIFFCKKGGALVCDGSTVSSATPLRPGDRAAPAPPSRSHPLAERGLGREAARFRCAGPQFIVSCPAMPLASECRTWQ